MPPIIIWSRGNLRARKVWIGDALSCAARCRLSALRQRDIAAFDVVPPSSVGLEADRTMRVIYLGPSWRLRENHRVIKIAKVRMRIRAPAGSVAAHRNDKQTGLVVRCQFTFARWRSPSYGSFRAEQMQCHQETQNDAARRLIRKCTRPGVPRSPGLVTYPSPWGWKRGEIASSKVIREYTTLVLHRRITTIMGTNTRYHA